MGVQGRALSGFDCTSKPGTCFETLLHGSHADDHETSATLLGRATGRCSAQGVGVHQTALYDFFSAGILLLFL